MDLDVKETQAAAVELKSISQIKRDMICPDCGDDLMNGGNCFFCYCGWSTCG